MESIKHINEYSNEYWYARKLSEALDYSDWRNFLKVLNKAKVVCKKSGLNVDEQLVEINKLSKRNNYATFHFQTFKIMILLIFTIHTFIPFDFNLFI